MTTLLLALALSWPPGCAFNRVELEPKRTFYFDCGTLRIPGRWGK